MLTVLHHLLGNHHRSSASFRLFGVVRAIAPVLDLPDLYSQRQVVTQSAAKIGICDA